MGHGDALVKPRPIDLLESFIDNPPDRGDAKFVALILREARKHHENPMIAFGVPATPEGRRKRMHEHLCAAAKMMRFAPVKRSGKPQDGIGRCAEVLEAIIAGQWARALARPYGAIIDDAKAVEYHVRTGATYCKLPTSRAGLRLILRAGLHNAANEKEAR